MRRAARKDANQAEIIKALKDAGAYVYDIGLPVDLLVGYKNHTILMEIKVGPKKDFTKLQRVFFKQWIGGTLVRVDGPEAALAALRVI